MIKYYVILSSLLFFMVASPLVNAAPVTITWENPTVNEDKSPIPSTGPLSLVSTTVWYVPCTSASQVTWSTGAKSVTVPFPGTSVVIEVEPNQTTCFRAFSKNAGNEQSKASNTVARTVSVKPSPPVIK